MKNGEVNRLRNGQMSIFLANMDCQENVRVDGKVLGIHEAIINEGNLKVCPFRNYIGKLVLGNSKNQKRGNSVEEFSGEKCAKFLCGEKFG